MIGSLRKRTICIAVVVSILFSIVPVGVSQAVESKPYDAYSVIAELAKQNYAGRQTGTRGYADAVMYVENQMQAVGMIPLFGEKTYRQRFEAGVTKMTKEQVTVNGKRLRLMTDYMPFSQTPTGNYKSDKLIYAGTGTGKEYEANVSLKNKFIVFHWNDINGKFPEGILDRVQRAAKRGAAGVFIVANGELKVGNAEHPLNTKTVGVPVLYLSSAAAADLGVTQVATAKALPDVKIDIQMTIDRSKQPAENLIGVIPGEKEEKAILYIANLDGFGSLPDNRSYESAKAGAAGIATMLQMASRYRDHKPEYTLLFAFVGGKFTEQEGAKALAEKLNFEHIETTVELYAMGGSGVANEIMYSYADPSYSATASRVLPQTAWLNTDLGNALTSQIRTKTKKLVLIRDRNTWIDDSITDQALNVKRTAFDTGVTSLVGLTDRLIADGVAQAEKSFAYGTSPVDTTFPGTTAKGKKFETKHFTVYADDMYAKQVTTAVQQEMDSIYERIAKANYYPVPGQKVIALYMKDASMAAKIMGRRDLIERPEQAGGGFANVRDGQTYLFGAFGPSYGNTAHELNHAIASANPYVGTDSFEQQEWQGQSNLVVKERDTKSVFSVLFNHEVPKAMELVRNYRASFDWEWYTRDKKNPNGHLYTYKLIGSMYTYVDYLFGENASRRAIYRIFEDPKQTPEHLVLETGLKKEEFLEGWSNWVGSGGVSTTDKARAAAAKYTDSLTWYDYRLLYTLPASTSSPTSEEKAPSSQGDMVKKGNVPFTPAFPNDDFQVTAFHVTMTSKGAEFVLDYKSKITSFASLFDPPDGAKLMKAQASAIKPGQGKIKFVLNSKEWATALSVPTLTMRFGNEERFLFIDTKYLKEL